MENTIKKLSHCRLCDSRHYKTLFAKENYNISKCDECGFIFLDFDPDSKFFTDYYSQEFFNDPGTKHAYNDYEKEAQNLKESFDVRCKSIRKYRDSGDLLDLGCATGAFLETASKYWGVYGVDVSEYAISRAKQKNINAFCGEIQNSPYINQRFDVITLWDTIEHISNPRALIQQANKILKPNGIIALTTGDVGSVVSKLSGKYWHLYNIPQHLSFFDKKTITKLLENENFVVKEISYMPINLTLDYLLFRLVTFYKLNFTKPIYNFLKNLGVLNKSININLYDIMFVIAQKK